MVDTRSKVNLGGLEWIIRREVNVKEKYPTGVRRIIRTHDCRLPVEHIVSDRACRAIRWWVFAEIDKLFVNSL